MIESTLKIARYCPLVIQGFSNFLGLFQGIMANPVIVWPERFTLGLRRFALSKAAGPGFEVCHSQHIRADESQFDFAFKESYVLGSKLPLFPYNRGWSSTQ